MELQKVLRILFIWKRYLCLGRAAVSDLQPAIITIEQWGYFSVQHLHWASVLKSHLSTCDIHRNYKVLSSCTFTLTVSIVDPTLNILNVVFKTFAHSFRLFFFLCKCSIYKGTLSKWNIVWQVFIDNFLIWTWYLSNEIINCTVGEKYWLFSR